MIHISENNVFHLSTEKTSYIMRVLVSGQIEHMYYGQKIPIQNDYSFLYDKHAVGYSNSTWTNEDKSLSLDHIALEHSSYGLGDYRMPSIQIQTPDGVFKSDFKYLRYDLTKTKPEIAGLPSSYGDSETLNIILFDETINAYLNMYYTTFYNANIITRSVRIVNNAEVPLTINSIMSAQIDLPYDDYTMLSFDGSWIRERYKNERSIVPGVTSVGSISGSSSSRHNPFFAVKKKDTTENSGECYGFNLVYSGNHTASVEMSPHGHVRVMNGINPFEFAWEVAPNDSFHTPESVLTYSSDGLNGMSHNMHDFVQENIVRGEWKYKERPVLVNNWEATYFWFNEKKILSIAKDAKGIGAELFVLDDGWFGKRTSDNSSLGDWDVNTKKLPSGIGGLAKKITNMGLMFGIWVEPEMVNEDSDLFRAHPEWAMTIDRYTPSEGRNQLILDMTRDDVQQFLIDKMTEVFKLGDISFVKWDMNRHFSDVSSHNKDFKNGEYFHRYILGLYHVLDVLVGRFPHILFESCSSGGNRFDLGMFCYMPQCWASDNTDAYDRIHIQGGTSYGYPQSVMTMHVAGNPSFASLRNASYEHRFNVSSFGLLGYELDVTQLTPLEKKLTKEQVEYYKEHRKLLQFGRFSRIGDFFTDNKCGWQITKRDGSEAMLGVFQDRIMPNGPSDLFKAVELNPETLYNLKVRSQGFEIRTIGEIINNAPAVHFDVEDGKVYNFIADRIKIPSENDEYESLSGAALMYAGFRPKQNFVLSGYNPKDMRLFLDNDSRMYHISKTETV